jgi:hypothetical protein
LGGGLGVVDDDYGYRLWCQEENVLGLEEVLGVENENYEKRVHGLHDVSAVLFLQKSRDCLCVE